MPWRPALKLGQLGQLGLGLLCVSALPWLSAANGPEVTPPPPPPPVAGGSDISATPPGGKGEAWQNKIDTKLDPKLPAKAGPEPLSDAVKKLGTDLVARETTVNGSRNAIKAMDYFKAKWEILGALDEFTYVGQPVRDQLAESNKNVAAYLRTNKKNIAELEALVVIHKQRLGLMNVPINVPPQPVRQRLRGGGVGQVSGGGETQYAKEDGADVSLDNTLKDGENPPLKLSATDKFKMSTFEAYLKRLQTYSFRHDFAGAENEYQYAADNIAGAYLFQLAVQSDPRWAWTYPETFKWLQARPSGPAPLPKPPEAPKKAIAPAPVVTPPAPPPATSPATLPATPATLPATPATTPSIGIEKATVAPAK